MYSHPAHQVAASTLSLPEEILLLVLDNECGDLAAVLPTATLHAVLAGAVLMELAFEKHVTDDSVNLRLMNATAITRQEDILSPTLVRIATDPGPYPIEDWIIRISNELAADIRDAALKGLVDRGILRTSDAGQFFMTPLVARAGRYPSLEGKALEAVKERVMRALFTDAMPPPRDAVIIGLASVCGLFRHILPQDELLQVEERIERISNLDAIGQAVARVIRAKEERTRQRSIRPYSAIPRLKGIPFLGNALAFRKDINRIVAKAYKDLGPVFRFRILLQEYVVMAGPEAMRWAQKKSRVYLRSHEVWRDFHTFLGAKRSPIGTDGPDHLQLRRVMTRYMSRRFFLARSSDAVAITRRVTRDWGARAGEDSIVEAGHAAQQIVSQQIVGLMVGLTSDESVRTVARVLDFMIRALLFKTIPRIALKTPGFRRRMRQCKQICEEALDRHRVEKPVAEYEFIDAILELHRGDPVLLPEADLLMVVLAPYFGGVETVARATAIALYVLLQHPHLMEAARKEADALPETGLDEPSYKRLDVMPRVVTEVLRRYPTTSVSPRHVANTFTFAGYRIPHGTNLLLAISAGNFMEDQFSCPDQFDIDRYLPHRAEDRSDAFVPFGFGPHRCAAAPMVVPQVSMTVLTLLRDFDLQLRRPTFTLKDARVAIPNPICSFEMRVTRRR